MKEESGCPFCGELAETIKDFDALQTRFSDCLCGEYIIDRKALEDYGEYNKILKNDEDKKLFSGY